MKVLITGATGTIGGAILRHLIKNPAITSIVTLNRRSVPSTDPKVSNIVVSDFRNWDKDTLASIADADAAVWALGTSDDNEDTNYNFILAFQEALRQVLPSSRRNKFRFVLVSGALVEPDQDKKLYFLEAARKLKGRTEEWSLEFAQKHRDVWQTWIIKPGGVATAETYTVARLAVGVFMPTIRDEQVGAFVADLLVQGEEPEGRVLNDRMAVKSTELLGI